MPLVSIVVPIYKVEKYLHQCIDSILAQTLTDIEVILVDDGSPDSCPAIVDEYAARDPRVIAIHQPNAGAGPARNAGLHHASGKYILFLDADDVYEPDMLDRMVNRANKYQADIVICKADSFNDSGTSRSMPHQLRCKLMRKVNASSFSPAKELPQHLFQFVCGWAWDKLYRRDFILNTGLQFQALSHTNDAYFVYLSLAGAGVVSIEPRVLVHHRRHSASISRNTAADSTCLITALLAIHEQIRPLAIPELEKSFHHWAMNMAVWHYRQLTGPAAAALQAELRNRLEPTLKLLSYGREYYPRKRDFLRYKRGVAPEISVILPIYNATAYLKTALDCILAQTFNDWEAICVNDGSTDDGLCILQQYANRDSRFRIIDGPNRGYGHAMNRGIDAAAGKYIAILEPDDELPRHAYRTLHKLAEKHQADIAKGCVSRFVQQRRRRNYYETTSIPRALRMHPICPRENWQTFSLCMNTWTCLYNRKFLQQHGIRHQETPGAAYQDNGLFFLSFAHAQSLVCTNDVVYLCRRDNNASSVHAIGRRPYAMRDEYAYIRRQLEHTPALWQQLRPVWLRKRLDNHFFTYAHLPTEAKPAYLADLKNELADMQNTIDTAFLTSESKRAMEILADSMPDTSAMDALLPLPPQQLPGKSLFCTRTAFKTTYHLCGIPLWSIGTKAGCTTWRLLGIPVKRIKHL